MKYLKRLEVFSDDIEDGDIVISIKTDLPFLIKNHKYIVVDKNDCYLTIRVKDIVDNQKFWAYKSDFIPEYEFNMKKFNM